MESDPTLAPRGHYEKVRRTILTYQAAAEGKLEVHYWTDDNGTIFDTRYAMLGEPIPEIPESWTPDFIEATGIVYAGVMSEQLLQERILHIRQGNGDTSASV